MKSYVVSSPGKLHLIGEHAVVYGKPAIIAAIGRRCFAKIIESKNSDITISSTNLEQTMQISQDIIFERLKNARDTLRIFEKSNNIMLLKNLTHDPLDLIALAIGETLFFYKKKLTNGFKIEISSEIPIGSGMGSSAAIALSTVAAISLFIGQEFKKQEINSIAFLVEKLIHGNPSGGDNSTCCFGGLLWFRKESAEFKIIEKLPFSLNDSIKKNFFIFNTGQPQETTGEMVSMVRVMYGKKPKFVESILENQEILTREMIASLKKGDSNEIIQIIKYAERNLENLGVVSSSTSYFIKKIGTIGGAAKISGAGGRKSASGIILAFHEDSKTLLEFSKKMGSPCYNISLGEEGLRVE